MKTLRRTAHLLIASLFVAVTSTNALAASSNGSTGGYTWTEQVNLSTYDNVLVHNAFGSAGLVASANSGSDKISIITITEKLYKNGSFVTAKPCSASNTLMGNQAQINTSSCYDSGASRPGYFKATGEYSILTQNFDGTCCKSTVSLPNISTEGQIN